MALSCMFVFESVCLIYYLTKFHGKMLMAIYMSVSDFQCF